MSTLEGIFGSLDWFGVDLDHTLIRYNNANLLPLIYHSLGTTLVNLGFLETLIPYNRHFCSRGLLFDARTGDILRINARGRVCAARHGYAGDALDSDDILDKYGTCPWRDHEKLMKTWKPADALILSTHFDSPAIQLLALMVDRIDAAPPSTTGTTDYSTLLSPLFQAFDLNFSPPHFSDGNSQYFNEIKRAPHRYVLPRQSILKCFRRLREKMGTRIMIITNSAHDYAQLLLKTAFGDEFQDEFDLIVYDSKKKRGFFTGCAPFIQQGESGKEWSQGNVKDLHTQFLGGADKTVVYCGDDVWGDTELVRRECPHWYTTAIVEELEHGYLEPKTSALRRTMWNGTSGLVCGVETTPMLKVALRCDLVCADLYDLCFVENSSNAMFPINQMSGPNKTKLFEEQKEEGAEEATATATATTTTTAKETEAEAESEKEKETEKNIGNNKRNDATVRVVVNDLHVWNVNRNNIKKVSEFCRASLEWSSRSGRLGTDDIPLVVQPASLLTHVPFLIGALESEDAKQHRQLQMLVPGKVLVDVFESAVESGTTSSSKKSYSINVIHLKSLVVQLGLSQTIEDAVRSFISKTLSPSTALKYLVSATEMYDEEIILLCLPLVIDTGSCGKAESDTYLDDLTTQPNLPSDILCQILNGMRTGRHFVTERVSSMYALSWLKGQGKSTRKEVDLSGWMDVVMASGALTTQRRTCHPLVFFLRQLVILSCPTLNALLESWLRTNYQQEQLIYCKESPPRGDRTWMLQQNTTNNSELKESKESKPTEIRMTSENKSKVIPDLSDLSESILLLENNMSVAGVAIDTPMDSSTTPSTTPYYSSADPETIKEGFNAIFNHVAVKRGWRALPFRRKEIEPVFDMAAIVVGRIRNTILSRNNGTFTLIKISGCSWDYLFSIQSSEIQFLVNGEGLARADIDELPPSHKKHAMQQIVLELAKSTLRDANGYVNGVEEINIVAEVARVAEQMGY